MRCVDSLKFRARQIVAERVRNHEVPVGKALHQRARTQAVGAVVGEIRFADHEQSGDSRHQLIIHPQPAHRVMDRRINAHRNFVRILICDAFIHFEQVAVALANFVNAQPLDRIREIEINAEPVFAHSAPFIAHRFRIPRSNVAGHQIAETRIPSFKVVVALGFGNLIRLPLVAFFEAGPKCARRCAAIRSSMSASIDNDPKPECTSDESA